MPYNGHERLEIAKVAIAQKISSVFCACQHGISGNGLVRSERLTDNQEVAGSNPVRGVGRNNLKEMDSPVH